ncbi:MAG TPA: hypothetical protein VFB89_00855 [Gemmatimonadales bacterium]|nr:hypothetical protein [Gemmatimonadales bacterium]
MAHLDDRTATRESEGRIRTEYPFEAFLEDLDALNANDSLPRAPFHRIPMAALPHFRAKYLKARIRHFRFTRFMLAMSYIAEHFHRFESEDLAVYGSDRVGGLISEALLRAVHQKFSVPDVFAMEGSPDPDAVVALARELRTALPRQGRRALGV